MGPYLELILGPNAVSKPRLKVATISGGHRGEFQIRIQSLRL